MAYVRGKKISYALENDSFAVFLMHLKLGENIRKITRGGEKARQVLN